MICVLTQPPETHIRSTTATLRWPAPQYDYATLFVPAANATAAQLGAETANPAYQPRPDMRPFTEKHPALLWIALVLVMVLLGAVAVRSVKATQGKVS